MATTTTNYNLIKPDASDFVKVSDLNTNMDLIDAALYELSQRSGGAQTAGIITHDMIGSVGVAGIMKTAEEA